MLWPLPGTCTSFAGRLVAESRLQFGLHKLPGASRPLGPGCLGADEPLGVSRDGQLWHMQSTQIRPPCVWPERSWG